jgi:hypothetical protein
MTPNNTKAAPDADKLIEQLLDGDRDVLTDAIGLKAVDGLQAIEVIHRGSQRRKCHYPLQPLHRLPVEWRRING